VTEAPFHAGESVRLPEHRVAGGAHQCVCLFRTGETTISGLPAGCAIVCRYLHQQQRLLRRGRHSTGCRLPRRDPIDVAGSRRGPRGHRGRMERRATEQQDRFRPRRAPRSAGTEERIIPILIGDTRMPTPDVLPPELEPLAYLNALRLRPDPDGCVVRDSVEIGPRLRVLDPIVTWAVGWTFRRRHQPLQRRFG
jgi:hypothetical protein